MFGLQSSPNRRKHARDHDRQIRRDSTRREVDRQLREQAEDWADMDRDLMDDDPWIDDPREPFDFDFGSRYEYEYDL